MPLIKRKDGVYLRKLPGFRKMFPFLMPTRTESVIFYSQKVRLRGALAWLDKANAGREKRLSIFHVVLAASARTLALRPDANRFIAGRRIYQRRTIDLSFVVKRELTEGAAETTVKITIDPRATVFDVAEKVSGAVRSTRGTESSSDEKTTALLTSLPRSITRLVVQGARFLDYFNLLPASYIRGDSLYTSVYLANLGSIGLDAVFHHMFEWGNAAFFIVVGKRKKEPVADDRGEMAILDVLNMNISLDERITDGVNYAATIAMLTDLIENPQKLETPPESLPDPYAFA